MVQHEGYVAWERVALTPLPLQLTFPSSVSLPPLSPRTVVPAMGPSASLSLDGARHEAALGISPRGAAPRRSRFSSPRQATSLGPLVATPTPPKAHQHGQRRGQHQNMQGVMTIQAEVPLDATTFLTDAQKAVMKLWQVEARWQSFGMPHTTELMAELKDNPPLPGTSPLGTKGLMAAEVAKQQGNACGKLHAFLPKSTRDAAAAKERIMRTSQWSNLRSRKGTLLAGGLFAVAQEAASDIESEEVMAKRDTLESMPLMTGVSKETIESMLPLMNTIDIDTEGHELIKAGAVPTHFFILVEGDVEIVLKSGICAARLSGQSKEDPANSYPFFGEIGMLTFAAAMAAVKTSCACTLLGVSRRNFPAFIALVPDLTQRITAIGDLRAKQAKVIQHNADVQEHSSEEENDSPSSDEEESNYGDDMPRVDEADAFTQEESKDLAAELRPIYQSVDVDGSGSVDEWELWSFISRAEDKSDKRSSQRASLHSSFDQASMTFEEMRVEMALVDVDGKGMYWEEFVALMLGKVEGTETLAAAMRTAYAVDTKLKSRAHGPRRRISTCKESVCRSMLKVDNERPLGDALLPVLRHVLSEQLPDDVAAVVRMIAADGSRVQLNATAPTGKQGMFAEGGNDPMHSSLLGDGELWDAWNTFYLREPGDGVLLGTRPRNEFLELLSTRFNVDASVPCTCKASVPTSELKETQPPDNLFLLRFEEGVAIRIQSVMPRSDAMHLWKPTDSTMRTLRAELGDDVESEMDLTLAEKLQRGNTERQRSAATKYNEERVTGTFAPLFFNTKADSSHVLPIRSTRRNIFVLHLMDVNVPITIVISTNPNGPQA